MIKLALFARLRARPGKESDVAAFLESALPLARAEPTTIVWYAVRLSPSEFAIFDCFADEQGRQTHLTGPIAAALMAKAPDLFAEPPTIERAEVIAAKV